MSFKLATLVYKVFQSSTEEVHTARFHPKRRTRTKGRHLWRMRVEKERRETVHIPADLLTLLIPAYLR